MSDTGHDGVLVTQEQEEQLVYILKRVDMGVADHTDTLDLAAALGLTQHFNQLDRRFDDEFKNTTDQRI